MTNTNIFETASNRKFRYPYKGMITTEDLWDLSLNQLDAVYKELNKGIELLQKDGLLTRMTDEEDEILTKMQVVSYIFHAKEAEAEARKNAAENSAKRQRILDILAKKKEDALLSMSEEELLKALEDIS